MRHQGWRAFGAALAVCGAVAAGAGTSATVTACGDTGATLSSPCPPGKTCQARLTLLHTADIHSRLLPYDLLITQVDANLGLGQAQTLRNVGGVARMSYVLRRERARSERALHFSGGDVSQGAPIYNFFQGEPEMRALNALETDAMAIANHEFDLGPLVIARQIQRWAPFAVLAANYKFEQADRPGNVFIQNVVKPFSVFSAGGLKVGVIGMGNLSSLTSIFDQPNRLGVQPLATADVAQFYIDLLRPHVDVVVFTTHLGLEVDQRMIRNTTGIDVVLGSHNHIVLNPPQTVQDCSADPQSPGFIWVADRNADATKEPLRDPEGTPANARKYDPDFHPFMCKRACRPRNVVLAHSGAFAKYVGRLDLTLSNEPAEIAPAASVLDLAPGAACAGDLPGGGPPQGYDPVNAFEVLTSRYVPFPINDDVPEDPVVARMLEPYRRQLDLVADLDILVGFAPSNVRRFASSGGDSPLGNLVANSMWLRLGVQTDFAMTNSAGIRADLLPGPITVEQMYNIFPFDNSITKMQLSGSEVAEVFDFVARRSAGRGCATQVQIAGARVILNCAGCEREAGKIACQVDEDCPTKDPGTCAGGFCQVRSCAEHVYIGTRQCLDPAECSCATDGDCLPPPTCGAPEPTPSRNDLAAGACKAGTCVARMCVTDDDCLTRADRDDCAMTAAEKRSKVRGACLKAEGKTVGRCLSKIEPLALYELATSNYIATGGSGFRVLQRNTTQVDTRIQQRDALIDYLRQGRPCGWRKDAGTPEGLVACEVDADCAGEADAVCACRETSSGTEITDGSLAGTLAPDRRCRRAEGRCVRRACRHQVATFHAKRCKGSRTIDGETVARGPDGAPIAAPEACRNDLGPCTVAGETCKFLSCVDENLGAFSDNRLQMIGR